MPGFVVDLEDVTYAKERGKKWIVFSTLVELNGQMYPEITWKI